MAYVERAVEPLVTRLLGELPALLLVGPRATGKTTLAMRRARTVVRLDRPAEAAAFQADPDSALRGLEEPVLLDEWQAVPDILGAVKRAVDADPRPGRFLLTGSVRAELDAQLWPGTGRLVRVPMYGLTVRELAGRSAGPAFLDRIAEDGPAALRAPSSPVDLREYVDLALRGGFPEPALHFGPDARQRWLESYVEHLVTRDAPLLEEGRNPVKLWRYLEVVAMNTAGVMHEKTLFDAAGISRHAAQAYEGVLRNLLVLDAMPGWSSNRLKRLVTMPKRYLVEPALISGVLRVDTAGVMRDGDLLGRTLDTFVAAQLRAEAPLCATRPRLFHLRQEQGRHEVDLVAELGAQRIVAIEVKADAAPREAAAQHLSWLRDRLGERFIMGLVLHTGPRAYRIGDRIAAAPIASLWS